MFPSVLHTEHLWPPQEGSVNVSCHSHRHPRTHWLSCFQRWKKSCDAISVGWKNLLMVTGSLRVRFCKAPPYLMEQKTHLEIHSTQSYQVTGGYLVTAQQVTTCGSVCSTAELKKHWQRQVWLLQSGSCGIWWHHHSPFPHSTASEPQSSYFHPNTPWTLTWTWCSAAGPQKNQSDTRCWGPAESGPPPPPVAPQVWTEHSAVSSC